jgi:hypothetical protein
MDEADLDQVLDRIEEGVRTDAASFIARDAFLSNKYHFGSEVEHEPVKAIQKEIDGMSRLLCALITEQIVSDDDQCLRVYQQEVEKLRELEREVISELPEREQDT